jgi:hypothetical protein
MSVNNTNPSTLFGGTWVLLTGGYVLKTISSGTGGSTNSAGNTGSTTLTAAQSGVPAHSHTVTVNKVGSSNIGIVTLASGGAYYAPVAGTGETLSGSAANNTAKNASQGHSHTAGMPQNIGVYVWKRTA